MGIDANAIRKTETAHKPISEKLLEFKRELTNLINCHSLEGLKAPGGNGIRDWVLADVMMNALETFVNGFHTEMYHRGEYSKQEYTDCGGTDGKCQCWDGEDCKEPGQKG